MKYPESKYKVIVHQHEDYETPEIIAYSTYAGKVVKGKAILHINDVYSEEKGVKLAIARCAHKIAKKRLARATKLQKKAMDQLAKAEKYVADMSRYQADAANEVTETEAVVAEILSKM